MINSLRLLGRASIARFDLAESVVAATPDDTGDARTGALTKLGDMQQHLSISLSVIGALDQRLRLRPFPLPPVTLQDLVRSGRRRLADERQRGSRRWIEGRNLAVERLRTFLEQ
jgi:hypothetical protein